MKRHEEHQLLFATYNILYLLYALNVQFDPAVRAVIKQNLDELAAMLQPKSTMKARILKYLKL